MPKKSKVDPVATQKAVMGRMRVFLEHLYRCFPWDETFMLDGEECKLFPVLDVGMHPGMEAPSFVFQVSEVGHDHIKDVPTEA